MPHKAASAARTGLKRPRPSVATTVDAASNALVPRWTAVDTTRCLERLSAAVDGRDTASSVERVGGCATEAHEMSRRNRRPTAMAEATVAVRLRRPKPPNPVPEHLIEIV